MELQKMKKSSSSPTGLKKGQWLPEEDDKLVASISVHGVGRWNSLALSAGLQRTGKSCRLRWLNYLRPNVRHGGFTLEEQLLILQLHYRWGNRWAKIAEQLPGRTDNDIKNYWRTRVLKQAKRLNCDVNSPLFKQAIHHNWIPGIEERIKFGSGPPTAAQNFRIPVDSTAEEHGDPVPEGGTLGSSSSFASEPVGSFVAQNMLDMNVNGRVIGPGSYERIDEQLMECALKHEDLEFLQHLLFGRTTL